MPINVLVVDDSAVMRAMIIKTMKAAEIALGDVHQAANGQEGLDILDQYPVDLALVDINMPVMPGDVMIDRIRANRRTQDLPIMVISTEGSEGRIQELLTKVDGFLQKPFTPAALRESLNVLLGLPISFTVADALKQAATESFEKFGFLFPAGDWSPAPANMAALGADRDTATAAVGFEGAFSGLLEVVVPSNLLPVMAANMMGEDEVTPEHQLDAFGEIANVICGNVLPRIAGGAPFRLGHPEVHPGVNGTTEAESHGFSEVAQIHLPFEQGQADLRLYVEHPEAHGLG